MSHFENPGSEDLEKGWSPEIEEIPGFLANNRSRWETLPEDVQGELVSLEEEYQRYKDEDNFPGDHGQRDELKQKIINKSQEISDRLPNKRIHLDL
jgi:hypothetical protein